MSSQTRGQLVTEALLIHGNTSLTTRANLALDRWLRSQALGWPYPQLETALKGTSAVPLASGAKSITFGKGSGGETLEVKRVRDPVFLHTSDYSTQARVRIRQLTAGNLNEDEGVNNPATWIGQPQEFKVRAVSGVYGQWTIIPIPVPDKAYLLDLDYEIIPADLGSGAGNDGLIVWYPNDNTVIQAIVTAMAQYEAAGTGDPAIYLQNRELLGSLVVEDRMKFGWTDGTNDQIGLDPNIFNPQVRPLSK